MSVQAEKNIRIPPFSLESRLQYLPSSSALLARTLGLIRNVDIRLHGNDFALLTGNSNPPLANAIASLLDAKLEAPASAHADTETNVNLPPGITTPRAVIIQSLSPPVNDNVMELILMIDALKRSGIDDITAVIPYYGYARAEKKDQSGRPIAAKVIASMIESQGASRIVTLDLHALQIEGFIDRPWDDVLSSRVVIPHLRSEQGRKWFCISPDAGAVKRTRAFAKRLDGGDSALIAIAHKGRDITKDGVSQVVAFECEDLIRGTDSVVVDDIWSGGSTAIDVGKAARQFGARTVNAVMAHGLFLPKKDEDGNIVKTPAQILDESPFDLVWVTDSINHPPEIRNHPKIRVVSVAGLLAEVIWRNMTNRPLRELVE